MTYVRKALIIGSIIICAFAATRFAYWIVSPGQYEEVNSRIFIDFKETENISVNNAQIIFGENKTHIFLNVVFSNRNTVENGKICICLIKDNFPSITYANLLYEFIHSGDGLSESFQLRDGDVDYEDGCRCYILKSILPHIKDDHKNFLLELEFKSIFSIEDILKSNKIINLEIIGPYNLGTYVVGFPIKITLDTSYPLYIPTISFPQFNEEKGKIKFYLIEKPETNPSNSFAANIIINTFDTKLFFALTALFFTIFWILVSQILQLSPTERQYQINQIGRESIESKVSAEEKSQDAIISPIEGEIKREKRRRRYMGNGMKRNPKIIKGKSKGR